MKAQLWTEESKKGLDAWIIAEGADWMVCMVTERGPYKCVEVTGERLTSEVPVSCETRREKRPLQFYQEPARRKVWLELWITQRTTAASVRRK